MDGPTDVAPQQIYKTAQELLRARTDCHATYLSPVELKWNETRRPSDEDNAMAREYFAQCLREHSVSIAEPPSAVAVRAAIHAALATELGKPSPAIDCVLKTQRDLDIPGWQGS